MLLAAPTKLYWLEEPRLKDLTFKSPDISFTSKLSPWEKGLVNVAAHYRVVYKEDNLS
jgi:hypothetical protein